MHAPSPTFALTGAVTIGTDPERQVLPRIKALVYKDATVHSSTTEALRNCLGRPSSGANIVGLGEPGVIFTGRGSWKRTDPEAYLSLANRSHWEPLLSAVGERPSHLVLCACHTGAGEQGARLLYELAKILNAPVSAPTGFVLIDAHADVPTLYLAPGAGWQRASPDATRPPEPL